MHTPSPRSDHRKQTKQEPSCVLLICIYDTIALEVTNQLIYQKFSKFGPIVKVLIFEKGEVTKLFIEFEEKNSAEMAKNAMDGTKLLGAICKMNIYFSNFRNVDLKNETSEGADFTIQEEMKNEFVKGFDHLSRSYEGDNADFLDDHFMMNAAFSQFPPRSKTDNPRHLQAEIDKANNMGMYHSHPMISEEDEFQQMIHNGINNLLVTQTRSNAPYSTKSTHSSNVQRINPSLKIKEHVQTKSSILCYSLSQDIKMKYVYNLFSNFGNISFISKKNKILYIKFRTIQFSAIAYTYLNDYLFMGSRLKLQTPYSQEEAYPKQNQLCECIFYDETFDRFTPHRSLTVNSPSQTLHVSSLKKDVCRENTLYKIFSKYGQVEAVKILCYSNEKNMALVKFYSMQDSFEAIATLHNEMFSGRRMQISFTKSKV